MTYSSTIPWLTGSTESGTPTFVSFPVDYMVTGMPTSNYWIKAFIDVDESGGWSFGDVYVQTTDTNFYFPTTNYVALSNRTLGVDITLYDLDSDFDGMPDWWEMKYRLNPFIANDAVADADGDGIANSNEYFSVTDPYGEGFVQMPEAKVLISSSGLYRITVDMVTNVFGMTESEVSNATFRLSNMGTAVPTVRDEGDVVFYGEAYRDIYTDRNVYFLTQGPDITLEEIVVNSSTQLPLANFTFQYRYEVQAVDSSRYTTNFSADPYYRNFYGVTSNNTDIRVITSLLGYDEKFDVSVDLAAIDTNETGSMRLSFLGFHNGYMSPHHIVNVSFNDDLLGSNEFEVLNHYLASYEIDSTVWNNHTNKVSIEKVSQTGDRFALDYVEVEYQRKFQLEHSQMVFEPNAGVVEFAEIETNDIAIWRVTDPMKPQVLAGFTVATTNGYYINFLNTNDSVFVACESGSEYVPHSISLVKSNSLSSTTNCADYLMIVGTGLETQAEQLADYRSSNGMSVAFANIEDVFDSINYGRRSGEAVRYFVQVAVETWSCSPYYVVLVGDGSMDLGEHDMIDDCQIPTEPWTQGTAGLHNSDYSVSDYNLDSVVDIALGRIPAKNTNELAIYVSNIMSYESGGSWRTNTMVANDYDSPYSFSSWANDVEAGISNDTHSQRIDLNIEDVAVARSNAIFWIENGLNSFIYTGHGLFNGYSPLGLLRVEDAVSLTNEAAPTLFLTVACQTGAFDEPGQDCISEALIFQPGGGVGAISSIALLGPTPAQLVMYPVIDATYPDEAVRLGDAFTIGQASANGAYVYAVFHQLLGDPALVINE